MIFWAIIIIILILGRLFYLSEPFGVSVDESTYLSIAEILNHGGTLYKDAVDRKPPGLFWLYQLIGQLFGEWNIHAVHGSFFIITLILCFLIYHLCQLLGGSRTQALSSALLFALASSSFPREITSANAENPMLLLIVLGMMLILQSKRSIKVLIGLILLWISCLFKQYAVIVFIPPLLVLCWTDKSKRIQILSLVTIAFFLVFLPVSIYFLKKNAFSEFLNYFLLDGLNYVSTSRKSINHQTSGIFAVFGMIMSWPALIFGIFRLKKDLIYAPNILLIFSAVLGSLLTAFLSARYYTHYFIPFVWWSCLLTAYGWPIIHLKKWVWILSVTSFLFFAAFNFYRDPFGNWAFSRQRQSEIKETALIINTNSNPKDRIVVWGMASQIYVMSQRGSASRFIFSDFVAGRQPGFKSPDSIPTPGAIQLFLEDLKTNQPFIIVDTSTAGINDYQWFPIERFSEIKSYIDQNYSKFNSTSTSQLWIRNK